MKKIIKLPSFFKGQIKNKKLRGVLKFFLSLFILYHLAMILIIPHRRSMIHEYAMPYFPSYVHTLSLDTSWNFYAPNPIDYYYFEYEVIDSKNKVGTFRWPPSRKEVKRIYLNHNRLIYHARFFLTLHERNISQYFILPYLCNLHSEAVEITVKVMFKNRPHFKKAKVLEPSFLSVDNKQNRKKWFSVTSKCKKRKKSRNINNLNEFLEERSPDEMDEK